MLLPKVSSLTPSRRRQFSDAVASSRFQIPHQQTLQLAWPIRLSGWLDDYPVSLTADAEWLAARPIGDWIVTRTRADERVLESVLNALMTFR